MCAEVCTDTEQPRRTRRESTRAPGGVVGHWSRPSVTPSYSSDTMTPGPLLPTCAVNGFDFRLLDDPDFQEDAVREEIIGTILKGLGYRDF